MRFLRALLRWLAADSRLTSRAAQRAKKKKRKDARRARTESLEQGLRTQTAAGETFDLDLELLLLIALWSPDWN